MNPRGSCKEEAGVCKGCCEWPAFGMSEREKEGEGQRERKEKGRRER